MEENKTIIVKTVFGSNLYGTTTPTSDQDFKGVFLPSRREILLGEIPRSLHDNTKSASNKNEKNTKDDIDCEYYSLHYFIKLACDGETAILDMLFTPEDKIIERHPIWDEIIKYRELFITKNLKAFVGYARGQAAKYGVKGTRLTDAENVLSFLEKTKLVFNPLTTKMETIWDKLPTGEHIFIHNEPNVNGERMYEVCGRKVGDRVTIQYAIDVTKKFVEQYGHRAKMAAENQGIDWKAISHAFRAGFEIRQLLTEKKITFPLQDAEFIKNVKLGYYNYNIIAPMLDKLIDDVEYLSEISTLPEKSDRNFWSNFIVIQLNEYIFKDHLKG